MMDRTNGLTPGQQVAVIVHDGDAVGVQVGDGGGHQMLDGRDLFMLQHAAGLQHHGGGGGTDRPG
jgi:hypothetical protein